jgi:uncharacterized protein YdhG (YjbR/CyaY superfamily)
VKTKPSPPKTVDESIASFPADLQLKLRKIRSTIKKAPPAAEEKIGYGIPGYKLSRPLIYFAVYKEHVGVNPHRLVTRNSTRPSPPAKP